MIDPSKLPKSAQLELGRAAYFALKAIHADPVQHEQFMKEFDAWQKERERNAAADSNGSTDTD